MFILRFDLRAPGATPNEHAALFRTAVEMSAWADQHDCLSIVLSEHHAAPDGYLPAPLVMAAAIAAVTEHVPLSIAATLLPLHLPARLAEELVVLDHLSRGRTSVVLGVGYREEEYALYGVDFADRGRIADDHLAQLLDHLAGSTGLTPAPFTPGGPSVAWGGASAVAARRAGRNGIGFVSTGRHDGLADAYADAAVAAGHAPGGCFLPDPDTPMAVFVNDDLDAGWEEVGPALLADATAYAEWNDPAINPNAASTASLSANRVASLSAATTVDELRAAAGSHRVVTVDEAVGLIREHGFLGLHPLVGGLDPAIAWTYLRRVADDVLPRLALDDASTTNPADDHAATAASLG